MSLILPPSPLYHVRHGQTDWNAEGRLQGQHDIPLNDLGREQAARNGAAMRVHFHDNALDPAAFLWLASPLGRSRETMEILRRGMGLDPAAYTVVPALRELTFGRWEGSTLPELKAREPEATAARKADKWGFVPPEGESYAMLSARIGAWLAALPAPAVVVSHGGVQRVLTGLLLGTPAQEIPLLPVPQDRIFRYSAGAADWF
ncbi:histidine phosphatase family protein [Pseudoxanthobacter sp.]|uniref:histidine phosphatase family protein n=1 Tax=Pseudoxanthobacter sp. TaxID=1925742 RepID=UPI002FE1B476